MGGLKMKKPGRSDRACLQDRRLLPGEIPAGSRATSPGCGGLTLFGFAGLLVEPTLLEVLEQPRTDHLATELLECPIQTIVFAKRDFNHKSDTSLSNVVQTG